MKKIVALVLALVMVLGCTAALADTYGLGISSSIGSSKDAADGKDGKAQVDSTVCALAVDADGKIVSCLFDIAQTKIGFSAAGAITADKTAEVKSKQELGDEYGMRGASAIGKEWNEQADALAAYCVGKTYEEVVAGVAADEKGYPTSADVVSGCTMNINAFLKALEKAYTMATAK